MMLVFKNFVLKSLITDRNTRRVFFSGNFDGNRPVNTVFGPLNNKNWRCNPFDVDIRQPRGCRWSGRVGRLALARASRNLQHTSSRSPYIASMLKYS